MPDSQSQCRELPATPARILMFVSLALVAGFGAAHWIERPTGPECSGIVYAVRTPVLAPCTAIVTAIARPEGGSVTLGEELVTLRDRQLERKIHEQSNLVANLESKCNQSLAAAELEVSWRVRMLDSEISDIQLKSAEYLRSKYDCEMRKNLLTSVLKDREIALLDEPAPLFSPVALFDETSEIDHWTTVLRLESVSNAAEVAAAQLEICELRQHSLEQLKGALPAQVRQSTGVAVAQQQLDAARAELESLQAQADALSIPSPAIGRMGTAKVEVGETVQAGAPITEIFDETRGYLIAHVPSQIITSFPVQSEVELQFPGNVRREGTVVSVAPQASPTAGLPSRSNDPVIEIRVEPSGKLWPSVPIGSQVRVRAAH